MSAKGLLEGAFLVSDNLNQAKLIRSSTIHKANLVNRLTDAATAAGDRATEALYSQRVVDCLEEMLEACTDEQRQQEVSKQHSAYLLRAVEFRHWSIRLHPHKSVVENVLGQSSAPRRRRGNRSPP